MHETGLAIEIANLALEALLEDQAAGKVKALHLKVGRWSGVEPETLSFALGVVMDGTELEGAKVEIELIEPTFDCASCGRRFTAENRFDLCPFCGGAPGAMVGGEELMLTHLDLED